MIWWQQSIQWRKLSASESMFPVLVWWRSFEFRYKYDLQLGYSVCVYSCCSSRGCHRGNHESEGTTTVYGSGPFPRPRAPAGLYGRGPNLRRKTVQNFSNKEGSGCPPPDFSCMWRGGEGAESGPRIPPLQGSQNSHSPPLSFPHKRRHPPFPKAEGTPLFHTWEIHGHPVITGPRVFPKARGIQFFRGGGVCPAAFMMRSGDDLVRVSQPKLSRTGGCMIERLCITKLGEF